MSTDIYIERERLFVLGGIFLLRRPWKNVCVYIQLGPSFLGQGHVFCSFPFAHHHSIFHIKHVTEAQTLIQAGLFWFCFVNVA